MKISIQFLTIISLFYVFTESYKPCSQEVKHKQLVLCSESFKSTCESAGCIWSDGCYWREPHYGPLSCRVHGYKNGGICSIKSAGYNLDYDIDSGTCLANIQTIFEAYMTLEIDPRIHPSKEKDYKKNYKKLAHKWHTDTCCKGKKNANEPECQGLSPDQIFVLCTEKIKKINGAKDDLNLYFPEIVKFNWKYFKTVEEQKAEDKTKPKPKPDSSSSSNSPQSKPGHYTPSTVGSDYYSVLFYIFALISLYFMF